MPTYTDSASVLAHLPPSPPTTVTNYTAADIADASSIVESKVGPEFPLAYKSGTQKFPDITDSPATPAIIKLAATWLAASFQYVRLGRPAREGETSQADLFRERAMSLLDDIRSGETDVILSGQSLRGTALASVDNPYYENREDPKEIFNQTELDGHWK